MHADATVSDRLPVLAELRLQRLSCQRWLSAEAASKGTRCCAVHANTSWLWTPQQIANEHGSGYRTGVVALFLSRGAVQMPAWTRFLGCIRCAADGRLPRLDLRYSRMTMTATARWRSGLSGSVGRRPPTDSLRYKASPHSQPAQPLSRRRFAWASALPRGCLVSSAACCTASDWRAQHSRLTLRLVCFKQAANLAGQLRQMAAALQSRAYSQERISWARRPEHRSRASRRSSSSLPGHFWLVAWWLTSLSARYRCRRLPCLACCGQCWSTAYACCTQAGTQALIRVRMLPCAAGGPVRRRCPGGGPATDGAEAQRAIGPCQSRCCLRRLCHQRHAATPVERRTHARTQVRSKTRCCASYLLVPMHNMQPAHLHCCLHL